jgi:outer membrane protein assembly factor BamB
VGDPGDLPESSPAIDAKGNLYVTAGSHIYAFQPNGSMIWQFSAPSGYQIQSSPALDANGQVLVTLLGVSDDLLLALSATSGKQNWQATIASVVQIPIRTGLGGSPIVFNSPVVGSDGSIYAASGNFVQAFSSSGQPLWPASFSFSETDSQADPSGQNPVPYPEFIATPMIGSDGTVYIVSDSQGADLIQDPQTLLLSYFFILEPRIFALNPKTAAVQWSSLPPGDAANSKSFLEGSSSPVIAEDGTIYWAAGDKLAAFSSASLNGLAPSPWPRFRVNSGSTGTIEAVCNPIVGIPLLSQADPNWGSQIYDHSTGKISAYGCALTCAANAD